MAIEKTETKSLGEVDNKSEQKDEPLRVLAILPNSASKELASLIKQTLLELNIPHPIVFHGDERFQAEKSLVIPRAIELADLIIADLSGLNPNIVYCVGYAHGLRKKVMIIIRQESLEIPWSLHGFLYIVYNEEHLEQLKIGIRNWVAHNCPAEKLIPDEKSSD